MNNGTGVDLTAFFVLYGITGVIGLAIYVWYLWSLSRLFPRIDLPASHGWIPVWNQWQLVGRAGLPGWLVLFALIPFLSIIALVVTIIAIHRLNTEHGKGAGFTILGIVLPPLWAMLLAKHIDETGHGAVRRGDASQAYAPPGYASPAAPGQPAQGQPYQSVFDQPGQQARPGTNAPYGQPQTPPYVQAPPPAVSPQRLPQASVPQSPVPQAAAPQPPAASTQSNVDALFGAPAPRQDLPPVPPQAPAPAAPSSAQPAAAQHITPVPPAPGSVQPMPSVPAAAPAPGQQPGAWGFSNTTEDAFERLAAQGAGPQAGAPLGYVEPPRPFSWPEQQAPVDPAAAVPVVPAQPEAAPVVPEAAPAQPEPMPAPEPAAAPVPEPEFDEAPSIFSTGERAARKAAATPAAEAVDAAVAAAAIPVATPAATPAATEVSSPVAATDPGDDDDDHTVVVSRRKRWGIELPSGEIEELIGDDVVVGRRPSGAEGVSLLKIADPTRTLSKSHVRMRRDGDTWTIEDLQSTNGVSVDRGHGVEVIEAGREVRASEHMIIGTLEVTLREMK